MNAFKKISIYIPLLVLAACAVQETPELESPADYDAAKIVVFGGSSVPGATRAEGFQEPSELGICNADQIKIFSLKGEKTGDLSASSLKLVNVSEIDLSYKLNYRDKWTSYLMEISLSGTSGNWFAFPSIAYNSKDIAKFTVSSEINKTSYSGLQLKIPSTLSATINQVSIPELYFGRLLPSDGGYESKYPLTTNSHEAEDMVYKYSDEVSWKTESDPRNLTGKLYRIVSQLNVNISEVSPNVEKIEMYLSNVPTQIGLYAKHRTSLTDPEDKSIADRGYFYPIVEATGDSQHNLNETLVCTVENNDSTEWTARLSTFLLPSDRGRTVTLKAYIKTVDDIENMDQTSDETEEQTEATEDESEESSEEKTDDTSKTKFKTIERTRLLRASQNYYLKEETSKVYFSKTPLPVYNAAENTFMSYPNVRVNVSGKLSDIFSEESESNVVIEICPNYDGEHNITIN